MLKTSFPDVAGAAKHWRVRVFRQRLGHATLRSSNAPHRFMDALSREALCRKLEAQARR